MMSKKWLTTEQMKKAGWEGDVCSEEKERFNHGHPVQVKAAQHAKDKSCDAGVQLWTENTFIAGYNEGYRDGYSDGFEAAMKIHDAVREHLEKEMFPVVQHEPLLAKHTKGKDEQNT